MLMSIPQCIILMECFWNFQWKIALWECCKHALLTWNSSSAMVLIWCLLKLSKFKMLYVSPTTAVFYKSANLQHHWLMKRSGSCKQAMQFFLLNFCKIYLKSLIEISWFSSYFGNFILPFSLIKQLPALYPLWEGILVWVVIDLQMGCKQVCPVKGHIKLVSKQPIQNSCQIIIKTLLLDIESDSDENKSGNVLDGKKISVRQFQYWYHTVYFRLQCSFRHQYKCK